jgi:hypothetical protein
METIEETALSMAGGRFDLAQSRRQNCAPEPFEGILLNFRDWHLALGGSTTKRPERHVPESGMLEDHSHILDFPRPT